MYKGKSYLAVLPEKTGPSRGKERFEGGKESKERETNGIQGETKNLTVLKIRIESQLEREREREREREKSQKFFTCTRLSVCL